MTDVQGEAGQQTTEMVDNVRESIIPRRETGRDVANAHAIVGESPRKNAVRTMPIPPVPNGWYAIAASADLGQDEVLSISAVDQDLVVFRAEDGSARVLDAYCPHLGAHLGGGRLVNGCIKCPYHGWEFGDDGHCTSIPYSEGRIPSRARVDSYRVDEKDGFIYFWHHATGGDPFYEVPDVPEVDDPGWSEPHVFTTEMGAALQEMAENNVDYVHLKYVHRRPQLPGDSSVFSTDGAFSRVVEQLPEGGEFVRDAYGPGVALLRVGDLMTIHATTTPIDRMNCRLHWHFYFPKKLEDVSAALMDGVTGEFGLMADVPIWRDKVFRDRPVLVKEDGPIAEFRKWYAQFYDGVEDEPPSEVPPPE